MTLGQSRIAIAALVGASLTMPAYSQGPVIPKPPDQQEIIFYREMTIRAAKEAVQDEAAKVEITFFSLRMGFSNYAHACGYVMPSDARPKQRFTYPFWGRARLFGSLKDVGVFMNEMASCNFLPQSPSLPADESFWKNLKQ